MNRDLAVDIAETIDGWMTRRELEWLFDTARTVPPGATWVELGTWKGRSFFTVAMGLPLRSRLVAVDSFARATAALPSVPTTDWVWDHFVAVLHGVQKLREDLALLVQRSDTASAGHLFADRSVDVIFFDADHSRDGLAQDIDAWLPKLKPGGLLCGHDYNPGFPSVVALIDQRFPRRAIVPDTSIWLASGSSS